MGDISLQEASDMYYLSCEYLTMGFRMMCNVGVVVLCIQLSSGFQCSSSDGNLLRQIVAFWQL